MKRVLLILGGMFLCASALMAQTCVGSRPGAGPDIPCNFTANGTALSTSGPVTIPPYTGGDVTKATLCWDTNNFSDSLAELDFFQASGYAAATVSRYVYDASSVTHHCVLADRLYPQKTFLFNAVSCSGNDGSSPFNCSRPNLLNSVGPGGSNESDGMQFTTGTPNAADTTSIEAFITGTNLIYQTHGGSLGLPIVWHDGPIPTYVVFTAITVDGSSCTVSIAGGACGSTGISFQPDCGGSEQINAAKNNYNTTVFSSGTYSGKYYCSSPIGTLVPGGISTRLTATVGASVGSHTLSVTFQGVNGSQANLGSTTTATWTFSVAAMPTPSLAAPTMFPTIPNLGAFNDSIANWGSSLYYQHWQQAITAPGSYCNGVMSSTEMGGFPPCSVLNYGGDRVTAQVHDYLAPVTTGWTATHHYNVGDMICTAAPSECTTGTNYVFIAHVAGSSGGTLPAGFATSIPGGNVLITDGTVKWYNAGNTSFWDNMTLRTSAEWNGYEGMLGNYLSNSEWNMFPLGTPMNCWRQYGTATCAGANYVRPIAYQLYPLVTGFGGTVSNQIVNGFKHNSLGTLRTLPYGLSTLIGYWLMTGTEPVTSVNELDVRADLIMGTLNEVEQGSNTVLSATKVTGSSSQIPSFDNGLGAEALIQLYDTEVYEGLTPDSRIPGEVLKNADWLWSNQYNITGSDNGFPYEMWTRPYNANIVNGFQPNLNMLYGPVYTWLWEMYGDSCTLPTSGVTCLAAGDAMAQHANDLFVGTGKNFNQIQKLFCDYYKWRTNAMPGTDLCILPDQNAYRGSAYPDLMEPFDSILSQFNPSCMSGATTATCVWYSYKPIVAATVKWGLTNSTINSPVVGGPSVVYDANAPLYKNTVNLTGLPTNTTIYFGVGGQDSAGNNGFSSDNRYCQTCGSPPTYSFTTSGTCTLAITTASLPSATQGQSYDAFVTATCGTPPYTFSISAGNLPAGLTMSSAGEITGISSTQGTVNFTVKVTDSATPTPGTATKPLSITTVPATVVIGPSLLPNGTVGTAYSQQLTASGGAPPYGWTIAGGSLPTSLSLGAINGKITGTPSVAGIYSFTIQVCGLYSTCGSRPYTVTIQSSGTSIPGMSGAATMSGSGIVQQ